MTPDERDAWIKSYSKVTVDVTQGDINSGMRCAPGLCPVAKAIRRVTKHKDVHVGQYCVNVGPINVRLPLQVVVFIHEFDKQLPVEPFAFELEYVPQSFP